MAQLKDTVVNGNLRVTGSIICDSSEQSNTSIEDIICIMPDKLQQWAFGVGNEPPMPNPPSDSELKAYMESEEISNKLEDWIYNGTILKVPNIESSADRKSRYQKMFYVNKSYGYDSDGFSQTVINYMFEELTTSQTVNVKASSGTLTYDVRVASGFFISYNSKNGVWKWNEESYGEDSGGGLACFTGNTNVFTSEGLKEIEEINIGDLVLSYNEKENINELKEIDKIVSHTSNEIYNINIDAEVIKASWSHPFYVEGKGKIIAKDLSEGDILRCYDNRLIKIKEIDVDKYPQDVYEIRVKDNNNYYVGTNSILVYNEDSILDN